MLNKVKDFTVTAQVENIAMLVFCPLSAHHDMASPVLYASYITLLLFLIRPTYHLISTSRGLCDTHKLFGRYYTF